MKIYTNELGHRTKMAAMPIYIPAKFHDFSVMLTNLKDSHDLTIVFRKIPITHELEE